MARTQQELVRQGYQVLIESLAVVDALRFIQHFSLGQGDYTQVRHVWLEQTSLDDLLTAMRQHQTDVSTQYDEIIE